MKKKVRFVLTLVLCTIAIFGCASATPVVQDNSSSSDPSSNAMSTAAVDVANVTRVNLNTASADEFLATVPGLGDRMVREFQEYRPYISIQQFRKEIGKYVDESQVTAYEKYVYVPIAINDADAETLQQIPGLDATEAESLISGRPYATVDDFLSRLSTSVSADELEIAKTYLSQ
jgi:DNA uptake protein ComE-like DNA-binding protein